MISLIHTRLGNLFTSSLNLLDNSTSNKQANARMYLKPANVRGGIVSKPIFMKTQELAHKKATNRDCRIAIKCELNN